MSTPTVEQLSAWLLEAEVYIVVLEQRLAAHDHCISGGYIRKALDTRFASVSPPDKTFLPEEL